MLKFEPINDEERIAMLSIPIVMDRRTINQMAEATDDWILVGSMVMKHRGYWKYEFSQPMNVTLYSHNIGVRRGLTDAEVNKLIQDESMV